MPQLLFPLFPFRLLLSSLPHSHTHILQQAKVDSVSLERTRLVHFDIYQNAVALALQFVASKLNWSSLASPPQEKGEDGTKSIESLLNLLAWQLATFWDTVQKVN